MARILLFLILVAIGLAAVAAALPFDGLSDDFSDPTRPSLNTTLTLVKRGCKYEVSVPGWVCDDELPKLKELVKQLQEEQGGRAKAGVRAVFYSNLDDPNIGADKNNEASWVVGWMKAFGLAGKFYWWADAVNPYWITAQANHIRNNQEKNKDKWGANAISKFNQCFYQALALAALHEDAYLMIAGGKTPKADSVWERVEFPSLTTNPKINHIYRVDPRPPKERGKPDDCEPDKPQLIWDRAKDKPFKPKDLPWICPWL